MNHIPKILSLGIILIGLIFLSSGCEPASKDELIRVPSTPTEGGLPKFIPSCTDLELTAEETANLGDHRYLVEETSKAATCPQSEKTKIITENSSLKVDVWFGCMPSASKTFKYLFLKFDHELILFQEIGENTYGSGMYLTDMTVVFEKDGYELSVDTLENIDCVYTYKHTMIK